MVRWGGEGMVRGGSGNWLVGGGGGAQCCGSERFFSDPDLTLRIGSGSFLQSKIFEKVPTFFHMNLTGFF